MEETRTGTSFDTLTDDALLELLTTEADRLPREAVDEFVRRGERMIEPLTRICEDEGAWEEDTDLFWTPVHATFILGAIGGEASLPGLFAALHFSEEKDVDWVSGMTPHILGTLGRPAVEGLKSRILNRDLSEWERRYAVDALMEIGARHPAEQGDILDFLRAVLDDGSELEGLRDGAGNALLRFIRPGDREALLAWARKIEAHEKWPLFASQDVEDAYDKKRPGIERAPYDWLRFYDPDQIKSRQERWRREDASRLNASMNPISLPEKDALGVLDGPATSNPFPAPLAHTSPKVGRNDPCPCGSGRKYKRCCLE